MPKMSKKGISKSKTVHKKAQLPAVESQAADISWEPSREIASGLQPARRSRKTLTGIVLLAAVLIFLYMLKNGMIVAAMVNGKPIFSWQLYSALVSRFGKQTLEGMVTEQLIADAAKNEGVTISSGDITSRENEMLKSIGGNVNLDDLLKYQGITKTDFDSQVRMQLTVEKILGKDISISDADISQFIASYSAQMVATEEAKMKEEARKAIFEQRIGQKVQQWLNDLKQKSSIIRFI